MDDDIIRILVTTDNHLGYREKDAVRNGDCFASFEEALKTAKSKSADMVLLAGDLFHENKPSRKTMHIAMEVLRQHCMGGDSVFMEVLNDQSEIFQANLGKVNYEDPFQAVSLPVFSIHGNHDDPTREHGSESLSALDLLAAPNLVNYFGKAEQVDDVEITPILLRKNNTLLAIYGLGAIRDERLNRMWNQKKIRFVRPSQEQGRDEMFNIFVLHQNRDYGRGSKNCIHESMIPEWMDLVIWGNEHECIPSVTESLVGTFRIYQPGSSVATSLGETENSITHPKHMGLIEIRSRKFRLTPIKFTQVRPFIYQDISLKSTKLNPEDPHIDEKIKKLLMDRVNEMIIEARESDTGVAFIENGAPDNQYRIKDPERVLIRLRVEHSGFPTLHTQRFGSEFMQEVANPSEMLLFAKQKKEVIHGGAVPVPDGGAMATLKRIKDGDETITAEESRVRVEDLVNESLRRSNKSLGILTDVELGQALEDFVKKRQIYAITDLVDEALERMQGAIGKDVTVSCDTKQGVLEAASKLKEMKEDKQRKDEVVIPGRRKRLAEGESDEDSAVAPKNGSNKTKACATAYGSDEDSDESMVSAAKATKAATGKGRGKTVAKPAPKARATKAAAGRGKKAMVMSDDDDDDFSTSTSTRMRSSRVTSSTRKAASRQNYAENVLDEEEEAPVSSSHRKRSYSDYEESDEEEKPKAKRAVKTTSSSRATSGKTAKSPASSSVVYELSDDDNEVASSSTRSSSSRTAPSASSSSGSTGGRLVLDSAAGKVDGRRRQLPTSSQSSQQSSLPSKSQAKFSSLVRQWD